MEERISEKNPPATKIRNAQKAFKNYEEYKEYVYQLLGKPAEFSKLKKIFHGAVLSSSKCWNFSPVETSEIKFLLGCFYLLLKKFRKSAQMWNEVYIKEQENPKTNSCTIFTNGFLILSTLPSKYQWVSSSQNGLHLLTIINLLNGFSFEDEILTKNMLAVQNIAKKVLEICSEDYKTMQIDNELENLECTEQVTESIPFIITKKIKNKTKDAEDTADSGNTIFEVPEETEAAVAKIASSNADLSFKALAKKIHYLLGQHDENRKCYRKLRTLFNDTLCNVTITKHFTPEEVDGLYFLRGCFYFVSTWNKLKAVRSWIHLYNRNKDLIAYGFELLLTFPEKYNWSNYAKANLHLSTIYNTLVHYNICHVFNSKDEGVCESILSLAEIVLKDSLKSYENSIGRLQVYINTPDYLCHSELVSSILDLLGDPANFDELAETFPSKMKFKREERSYVEFLRGCFYFMRNKDRAINLWIRNVNAFESIFEEGFKTLATAPKDYEWSQVVQNDLHLNVILKYLKNFGTTSDSEELSTLIKLVNNALLQSPEEYRLKNTKDEDKIPKEDNQECYGGFGRQHGRKRTSYPDLIEKIGQLLGHKNSERAEKEMKSLVISALRNASSMKRVNIKFWQGCFYFRCNHQIQAIHEWIEIFQMYGKNEPVDENLRLLTVWPNQYSWCKSAKDALNLQAILLWIESFRSGFATTEPQYALESLEVSVREAITKYLPTSGT